MKVLRIGLWLLVALVAGAMCAVFFLQQPGSQGVIASDEPYGAPFTLVDQDGERVSEETLRGRPSAVFFGFTHCPEVCPTTLYELSRHQQALAEEGGDFRIVFVTVDPERDTPEVLGKYVEAVGGDILALSGEPAEITEMLQGWGILARKVEAGETYTMDHTATTLLIDEEGKLEGTIGYGEDQEMARAKLERLTGV